MTPSTSDDQRRHPRLGWTLYGVAAGALFGMLYVASGTPDTAGSEMLRLDTAPTVAPPSTAVAALDAGVDWSKVEPAGDFGPMAIAAYER